MKCRVKVFRDLHKGKERCLDPLSFSEYCWKYRKKTDISFHNYSGYNNEESFSHLEIEVL